MDKKMISEEDEYKKVTERLKGEKETSLKKQKSFVLINQKQDQILIFYEWGVCSNISTVSILSLY